LNMRIYRLLTDHNTAFCIYPGHHSCTVKGFRLDEKMRRRSVSASYAMLLVGCPHQWVWSNMVSSQ
jgi:hypothetical protein